MKLFGYEVKKATQPSRINKEAFNKLYDILLRYLGKGQIAWNQNDLRYIIESGYLFNPDTYSIINKIIETASTVQLKLYEIKDEKSFRQYKNLKSFSPENIYDLQRKAFEPVEQSELFDLFENPNKHTTYTLFIQSLLGYYCLLGNSYLNKLTNTGNPDGLTKELQVLPASLTKIVIGDALNPINGYTIEGWNNNDYKFTPEEIYHFKTFNPDYEAGQFMYGALPANNPILKKSNDSYTAACSLLENLGMIGILSSGNDDTIDPDLTKKMEDKLHSRFGGAKNAGKKWVVGHKMEWINLAQSMIDLNLIQGQEQDFIGQCRVYNVDPRLMGYAKYSAFNNMKECRKDFISNNIIPKMYMLTEAINKFVVPAYSLKDNKKYYMDIDIESIPEMQADTDALSARLQSEIEHGIITPADAAKMLARPELTDEKAKQLYMKTSVVPLNPKPIEPKMGV